MDDEKLIKSKERVQQHGEVFTPQWMVKKMLDVEGIKQACENIDATFLEPAAGDGNFLVAILERKLKSVTDHFSSGHWKTKSLIGRQNNGRTYKWIKRDYVTDGTNLNKYKVILPNSNGTGAIGEVLSTPLIGEPLIGEPLIGTTQTFITVGKFETLQEAEFALKYIKSKFARTLLGVMKITQHNTPETWRKVPLQNFTPNSDIDWTKSIYEIDQQLYDKYGLDECEIAFIEEKVKSME